MTILTESEMKRGANEISQLHLLRGRGIGTSRMPAGLERQIGNPTLQNHSQLQMTPRKIDRMPMLIVRLFKARVARRFFGLVTMLMLASCAHQKTYVTPNLGVERIAILEV